MDIQNWVNQIIKGLGGFLSWEDHEMPTYHNTREEQIAAFVLRCLANPECKGSQEVLEAIMEKRGEAVPDYGTGFRPPWKAIHPNYKYCMIDRNGRIFVSARRPVKNMQFQVWEVETASIYPFSIYPSSIGSLVENWHQCLWIRPGHEKKEGEA